MEPSNGSRHSGSDSTTPPERSRGPTLRDSPDHYHPKVTCTTLVDHPSCFTRTGGTGVGREKGPDCCPVRTCGTGSAVALGGRRPTTAVSAPTRATTTRSGDHCRPPGTRVDSSVSSGGRGRRASRPRGLSAAGARTDTSQPLPPLHSCPPLSP